MKKLWFYVTTEWQSALLMTAAAVVIISLLSFRLGSLTPGAHPSEISMNQTNPSFTSIVDNPVNAPYFVTRNVLKKVVPSRSSIFPRAISAAVGLVSVVAFFGLLSIWYRPRVAILGTILFASSSWVLHLARIGLPEVLQLISVLLILLWALLQKTNDKRLVFIATCLTLVGALYIPGMIWLVIAGAIWKGKYVWHEVRSLPKAFIVLCIILSLLLVTPLFVSAALSSSHLIDITGASRHLTVSEILHHLRSLPVYIAIKGPLDSRLTVGKAPLLDVFSVVMVILGFYSTVQNWRLDRSKLILGLLLLGIMLFAINNGSLIGALVVPIFLLAAEGIAYLLDTWMSVFPRNPLAKGVATTLITVAVLLVAFYQITNYFIAWPNASSTRAVFSQRL